METPVHDQRDAALQDILGRIASVGTERAIRDVLETTETFLTEIRVQHELESLLSQAETIGQLQRFKALETILAFIIDVRGFGELTIPRSEFDRWVEAHPFGGHVEDTGPDDGDMRLIVHHASKPE